MCEFVCDFNCKCDFCPRSDVCLTSSAQDPHTESSMLHRLPNDINGNDDNDDGNGYIKNIPIDADDAHEKSSYMRMTMMIVVQTASVAQ